ncbi:MAG: murein biosynthesis integral membrane protein MurJ [Candidatus Aminicenantes bacterium]|nr:murein biosynthesis integral membrane protein MurJ [Candidatus Aminicenantes bacterium]
MKNSRVVFTGGGTGGHVYPNIAIYEAFREKYPESSFLYIGTKNGAEERIVSHISQPIEFVSIQSRGIPQKIKSLKTMVALVYIFIGFIKSFFILMRFKPDIVIGSGGYVTAPVLIASALLKLKVFIHEQNAVPGRLNRYIARFATKIGVSFSSTSKFFPEKKVVVTGYPLRKSITKKKELNVKEKYNIPQQNQVLFVCGGSSGARTINNALVEIIPRLLELDNLTIIISTGRGYSREYRAFDDTMGILQNNGTPTEIEGRLIIREYFDNIDEIYSISNLIVTRAGAGTIKEITTLGIPSILIPKIDLPGDHQILNANEIQKIGGAEIVYEEVQLKDDQRKITVPEMALFQTIKKLLSEPRELARMKRNLKGINRGDSAHLILQEIEQIVKAKDAVEERQVKVFYLQAENSEKSHELIFDSTTLGNSILCDIFLEGIKSNVVFKIKNINNDEKLILKKIRGQIHLNGDEIKNWSEIKENDQLKINDNVYILKSYLEKIEQVNFEKSTSSKIWGSSFGILISRLGGFFREIVFAAMFGAGKAMSIFAVGLTISNFMRRVVAENALENAFLPIFSRIFHRSSRKKTWKSASSIINFSLLLAISITILGILVTPWLIKFLFPLFAEKGMTGQTINMTRIMFPYLILVTVAAILATYLKAFNRFGLAESSAIFFSIGTIIGVIGLHTFAGIYSLAYGVLLGGALQILFLLPFIIKLFKTKSLQFFYTPAIQFNSPSNKKYYSQVGPISIDVILSNTSEIIAQILASGLKIGAIAFLYYAKAIFRLPFAIVSQAINSVILKEFSDKITLFHKEKAKKLFIDGIKTNLFLLTPISIFMIVMADPIVSLIYGRGEFTQANVMSTSFALKFYSIGLIGWGIHSFTVRIFSARMDIKTSMVLNFFMLAVNIVFCLLLVRTKLTYGGLALATSISYLLFSVIRVGILKFKLERENIQIDYKDILISFFKTLLASLFVVVVLIEAKLIFRRIPFGSKTIENIILLISLLFIGIAVYLLISLMLRNTEILIFRKSISKMDRDIPISMLSPFQFLNMVSKSPQSFREDYFYKINIYISSRQWEIRNVGIKLIGLFQDRTKIDFLINLLKSKNANGFLKRNALVSLKQINFWDMKLTDLIKELLNDPYYEVRTAAIDYLGTHLTSENYEVFREMIHKKLKRSSLEEKINCIKLIAKIGSTSDLTVLNQFYLSSNSILREELLQLMINFYKRNLITKNQLKHNLDRILKTSNNLSPEFKLKNLIKKVYEEFELK